MLMDYFAFSEFVQYCDTSKYIIDIPTLMNLVVAEVNILANIIYMCICLYIYISLKELIGGLTNI